MLPSVIYRCAEFELDLWNAAGFHGPLLRKVLETSEKEG